MKRETMKVSWVVRLRAWMITYGRQFYYGFRRSLAGREETA